MTVKNFHIDIHYHRMRKGYLIYSFRDSLTQESMNSLFQDIERKIINEGEHKLISKRIFNILVELAQNTYKNISSLPLEAQNVLIMVQKREEGYELISGNFLHKKCADLLQARLRMINFLTEEQLDQLYLGVLANERISEQQGAGLGLLDVARKSKNIVDFQVNDVDDELNFFTIKSMVKVFDHEKI